MNNKLTKSRTDKSISGVCGGIAEYFGISSLGVRLIFLLLPANILIYIILVNTMHDSPRSL
ncbi:PspC domain-containing protein [Rossellomorea vietnamensis]|uniref:PspC domain-containing protein n=1 Tax=Rossellomorea vietnamensis TaxID=218284 RepID=A0A6I6UI94_9BACI|nr:PspC domain-containing protein [Rossellomorea vietnamensis]QHE62615.1 PspC domain-containing protein [Rossellomorea vietnamensis]